MVNRWGYVRVNSLKHFVANPSPYPVTLAVTEIPMNQ